MFTRVYFNPRQCYNIDEKHVHCGCIGPWCTPYITCFTSLPKTGGTTVEVVFVGNGVRLGQYAFQNSTWIRKYKVRSSDMRNYSMNTDHIFAKCSTFHIPPATFIPKSFTIIREPFSRYFNRCTHVEIASFNTSLCCIFA